MLRTILTILSTLAAVAVVLIAFHAWPGIAGRAELTGAQLERIRAEGRAAIASRDVPVGALLLFGDSVIGVGHNTVMRDGNAGGHAEINAISDVMSRIGVDRFNALNRDSLRMVSTFEPCLMCRGALLEYGIRHITFLKPKTVGHWIHEDLRTLLYELRCREGGHEDLQDSLFQRFYDSSGLKRPE